MKCLSSVSGFSLLEILMATFLAGIVVLGTSAMIRVSGKFQRTVQDKSDFRNLTDEIALMTDNPKLCERAIVSAEHEDAKGVAPMVAKFDPDASSPEALALPHSIRIGSRFVAGLKRNENAMKVSTLELTEADAAARQTDGKRTTYLAQLTIGTSSSAQSLTPMRMTNSSLLYVQTDNETKRILCCSRNKDSCESVLNRRYMLCTVSAILDYEGTAINSVASPCNPPAGASIVRHKATITNGGLTFGAITLYSWTESGRTAAREYTIAQVAGDTNACVGATPEGGWTFGSAGCFMRGGGGGACLRSICMYERSTSSPTALYDFTQAGDGPGCWGGINCANEVPMAGATLVSKQTYLECPGGRPAGQFCLWRK